MVSDLARPSGLALLRSAMPGASGPTVLWSDLEEKKIYGIDVAEENSTREVWVEGTRRFFSFGSGDFPKKKEEQHEIVFLIFVFLRWILLFVVFFCCVCFLVFFDLKSLFLPMLHFFPRTLVWGPIIQDLFRGPPPAMPRKTPRK